MKKEGYFKKNYRIFRDSFKKIDLRIFQIIFFDLVFYSLIPLIAITTFKMIESKAKTINLPMSLLQLETENAEKLLSDLTGFYFLLIATVILILLTIIIDWSIFKGLAWGFTVKRKFNFKFFLRFFLLNLAWLGIFIILIFLFAFAFKQELLPIYMSILLIVWIYFTNIIYALFTKKGDLKSIKKAFKLGFTKVHYFILPYTVLLVILLIIYFIMSLITFLPYGIGLALIILILLFYFAWARFYIVDVVSEF